MKYKVYGQNGHARMDYNGVPVISMPVLLRTRLLEPVELLNMTVEQGLIRPDEGELSAMKRDLVALVRTMKQDAAIRLMRLLEEED